MSLVVDSSIALAWIYQDEARNPVRQICDLVIEQGAWVTGLWRLEVANVLETGVRRGRTDAKFRDATLDDLALLPLQLDIETDRHAWGATLRLAERYKLSLYDAAYIELALRRSLPLATLDQELRAAARAENVLLLGT